MYLCFTTLISGFSNVSPWNLLQVLCRHLDVVILLSVPKVWDKARCRYRILLPKSC